MVALDELFEKAKLAAIRAGEEILLVYENHNISVEFKEDNSPLTVADRRSHEIIKSILSETNLPILSEEGSTIEYSERSSWDLYWCVDPLDGTKEFIKRNGEFTVNISLVKNSFPIFGVVYVPVSKELFFGGKDYGAFKMIQGGLTFSLSSERGNIVNSIVASRTHLSKETEDFISRIPGATCISMGSSLKFMLVATGDASYYPRFAPTMEWDTAAAQAVLEGAGGLVVNYPSLERLGYNKPNLLNNWFLACCSHEILQNIISISKI